MGKSYNIKFVRRDQSSFFDHLCRTVDVTATIKYAVNIQCIKLHCYHGYAYPTRRLLSFSSPLVAICIAHFHTKTFSPQNALTCFVWFAEQTDIISPYGINCIFLSLDGVCSLRGTD